MVGEPELTAVEAAEKFHRLKRPALPDSGLTSPLLGLESFSRNVLQRLGKNSTPACNLAAIEAVRRAG